MRPTDENQPASTRPNLISSARSPGGEDNILAMLERDSARGLGRRLSRRSRGLWYGAGAGVAAVLVGALVWLAYENNAAHQDRTLAQARPEAAQTPALAAPAPVVALGPKEEIVAPAQAAVIIDNPETPAPREAAAPPPLASTSEPPPLVLLTPKEAGAKRPAPPVHDAAPAAAAVREPVPVPVVPVSAVRERPPVRQVAPARVAPVRVAASKPLAAPGRPPSPAKSGAKASAAAKPALAATARTKKAQGAAAPQNADAPVDSDVALISAIISHVPGHAAERAQGEAAGCSGPSPDKKCAARPAQQR